MSSLQVYKVNEDDYINDENLHPKFREFCETFILEISNSDMLQLNNLILNSEKEFPFDGITSFELWNIMMMTGVKVIKLHKEGLIDLKFKENILDIIKKINIFGILPDNIKLKRVESEVE